MLFAIASSTASATTTLFTVDNLGNVAAPVSLISCGGVQTNANGVMSCTSDVRLKNVSGAFIDGLSSVMQINPETYSWKQGTPLYDGGVQYSGFIAQNIQQAVPEAISTTTAGFLQINTTTILATVVNAIKDIASIAGAFKDNLVAWLGNATNGIEDIFASGTIHAHQFCAQKSDGTEACVTGDQLATLLANSGQSSSAPSGGSAGQSVTTTNSTGTPPVIQINGANPAVISIGDRYSDLGATITSPQQDLDLGIKTFLNGALVSDIIIDTSLVATDTIDYVAADQNGLTSTSTRTVIVESASSATTTQPH